VSAAAGAGGSGTGRTRPNIRVVNWWTGAYAVEEGNTEEATRSAAAAAAGVAAAADVAEAARFRVEALRAGRRGREPRMQGDTAKAQLHRARERAAAAQRRIRGKMGKRQRNFSSGINPGVVLAALLFCGFAVAMLSLVNFRRPMTRPTLVADDARLFPPTPLSPTDPHGFPAPPTPELSFGTDSADGGTGQADQDSLFGGPRTTVSIGGRQVASHVSRSPSRRPSPAPAVHPAPTPVTADADVLILCDWSTLTGEQRQTVERRLADMTAAGFRLQGDSAPASVAGEDHGVEITADLRSAIGVRPFGADDTREAIRSWVRRHDDTDLVVWISSAGETLGSGPLSRWIVGPESTPTAAVIAAKAVLERP